MKRFRLSCAGFIYIKTCCVVLVRDTAVRGSGAQSQFCSSAPPYLAQVALGHAMLRTYRPKCVTKRMTHLMMTTTAPWGGKSPPYK